MLGSDLVILSPAASTSNVLRERRNPPNAEEPTGDEQSRFFKMKGKRKAENEDRQRERGGGDAEREGEDDDDDDDGDDDGWKKTVKRAKRGKLMRSDEPLYSKCNVPPFCSFSDAQISMVFSQIRPPKREGKSSGQKMKLITYGKVRVTEPNISTSGPRAKAHCSST